jgi:hypothetical protein
MTNQFPEWVERQIVTFALANPGLGPRRLAAQLAQPNPFGELKASASGVLKVLHRAQAGPGYLPGLLQLRAHPHRPVG